MEPGFVDDRPFWRTVQRQPSDFPSSFASIGGTFLFTAGSIYTGRIKFSSISFLFDLSSKSQALLAYLFPFQIRNQIGQLLARRRFFDPLRHERLLARQQRFDFIS